METIFRICLCIAGIVNMLPSFIAFFPDKISKSYGVEISDSNYELLLRHRAVLFGIIGGIMIYSAITKKNYTMAVTIGMISMISFVVLSKLVEGSINIELAKVVKADYIAIVILLIGFVLYKFK